MSLFFVCFLILVYIFLVKLLIDQFSSQPRLIDAIPSGTGMDANPRISITVCLFGPSQWCSENHSLLSRRKNLWCLMNPFLSQYQFEINLNIFFAVTLKSFNVSRAVAKSKLTEDSGILLTRDGTPYRDPINIKS